MAHITDSSIDFNGFLPEGESLFDFQQVGVAYALVTRRAIIGDEMGLGKTRQALVAAEAAGTFPLVVVCPASLKANWAKEAQRCLPGRSVQVLGGRKPFDTYAEIIIVNYDILSAWAEHLDPAGLILDESHYAKEAKSQRTKAAKVLAARVPASGLVLLLTGTPILNRPVELVEQLRILGTLEQVAPRPRAPRPTERDWEYAFKFTFCGPTHNGHGYEFKGASNLDMLNERLRSSCLVRRLRNDVLGMEDTIRQQVALALNGKLNAYRKAESNFLAFIEEKGGPEAALKAARAIVITQMNALRKLAGAAKVEAAVEYVANYLDSNPEKSIVLFADHIEVQQALLASVPGAARILGGQSTDFTEAEKARFLAGETRVIVCSLKAAREGHTLVGPEITCHDVLFVEQGWNPGTMQQAEDRINRIGQTAQYVYATTLLAEATIDEDIALMIEEKRHIFNAAINGQELPEGEGEASVQEAVLRRMAGRNK
jgi:SWI/SNF-related matrix-associated actin-dependent regulator of chromatin subfamily A-like protein 1